MAVQPQKPRHAFYKIRVKGTTFELPGRYTKLRWLGGGSYGQVVAAEDSATSASSASAAATVTKHVAIKRVGGVFRHRSDAKRILREMRILRHLRNHSNIVGVIDMFYAPLNTQKFSDIYMVTSLFESDLHRIIASEQKLSDAHARYFLYQVLRGLKYVHSANIIHRDLKPANLLINSDCKLAICDFGLSRGIPNLNDSLRSNMPISKAASEVKHFTHYVVTRWYRAPELLAESEDYGKAIDIWSVGCILAEILGRRVLFRGRDYLHQMHCILRIIGTPTDPRDLLFVTKNECLQVIRKLGHQPRVPWSTLFPNAESLALDLLDKLLAWNPESRITAEQALQHPWFAEYHDDMQEPRCDTSFDFDADSNDLHGNVPLSKIRKLMLAEISEMKGGTMTTKSSIALASSELVNMDPKYAKNKGPRTQPPAEEQQPAGPPPAGPPPVASSCMLPVPEKNTIGADPLSSQLPPAAGGSKISEKVTASVTSAVREKISEEITSRMPTGQSHLETFLSSELAKMEARIMSQMRTVVDEVVTMRLKEFAQLLEDGAE